MNKIFFSLTIIASSALTFASAPKSEAPIKKSEKCPQMLKGFEAAQKMTLPAEQLTKMKETLQKNGCLK